MAFIYDHFAALLTFQYFSFFLCLIICSFWQIDSFLNDCTWSCKNMDGGHWIIINPNRLTSFFFCSSELVNIIYIIYVCERFMFLSNKLKFLSSILQMALAFAHRIIINYEHLLSIEAWKWTEIKFYSFYCTEQLSRNCVYGNKHLCICIIEQYIEYRFCQQIQLVPIQLNGIARMNKNTLTLFVSQSNRSMYCLSHAKSRNIFFL